MDPAVDPDAHYALAREHLSSLDPNQDTRAARLLAETLAETGAELVAPVDLRERFADQRVIVIGPVPGNAETVDPARPIIAAGSSVEQCLSAGIQPALVVTDLDGSRMAHEMFSRIGVPTAIHAHGDNQGLIRAFAPELEGPVFATCQTPPPHDLPVPMHRFGGFTDGDRACFIAAALGAESIELAGWDLSEPVDDRPDKAIKLEIAKELLALVPVPVTLRETREPSISDFTELEIGEGVDLREL